MKEKYRTPEIEITEFDEEACVTMSGVSQDSDNIVDVEHSGWE